MEKIEKFDSSKYLLHLVYTPITRSNKMKKHKICSKCGKNHNEWIKGTHCKNCRSLSQKVCYEKNKKHYTENANRYYQNNKKDKLEYAKKYRLKNKDKYKDYFAKNAEQIYKRRALREKERRENDISFRIQCNLRSRLRNALNGKKKLKHCIDLFGCLVCQAIIIAFFHKSKIATILETAGTVKKKSKSAFFQKINVFRREHVSFITFSIVCFSVNKICYF